MNPQQLEIGLPQRPQNPAKRRRQLRAARARWWFNRMRSAVESTVEWTPPVRRSADPFATPLARGV